MRRPPRLLSRRVAVAASAAIIFWGCKMGNSGSGSLDPNASCANCVIEIDSVTTLPAIDLVGPPTSLARSPKGDFYFGDLRERALKVYDRDGRFVRQIGRTGGGPGEYEQMRNILFDSEGSLHLLDGTLFRHSVFDSNGKFRGSHLAPIVGDYGAPAVLLSDGRLVINAHPRPGSTGSPVLLVDSVGTMTGLEGQIPPAMIRRTWLSDRLLWKLPSGGLLVGQPYAFVIDFYDPTLKWTKSSTYHIEGVQPTNPETHPSDGTFDEPYTPHMRHIWTDADGRIWIYSVLPTKAWSPGPPLAKAQSLSQAELIELSKRPRFESLIEVFDGAMQHVIARVRFGNEQNLGLPFGEGYFAKTLLDAASEPGVRISRVHLNRQPEVGK